MYKKYFKRIFDFLLSIIILPFYVILLVPVSLAIKLDDGGPVFYCGNRLGKNGKVFGMYKFRTMIVNAPDIRTEDGSTWNSEDDMRLTRIGRILRKFSLDEVPQVFNIIIGDMSFIGPRPDTVDSFETYSSSELRRLDVLPGITGYSQAYYRNSIDAADKIKNDVFYVENMSFVFDLKIVIKTAVCIFKSENVYTKVDRADTEIIENIIKKEVPYGQFKV